MIIKKQNSHLNKKIATKQSLKSESTTMNTSRPGSSSYKFRLKSAKLLTTPSISSFDYYFIRKIDTGSIATRYYLEKALELYTKNNYTAALELSLKASEIEKNN